MMTKRLKKNDAMLVVIDFQEKLMPAMYDRNDVEEKTARMIRGAKALGLPVVVTQQYTRGLGETVPVVAEALGEYEPIDKVTFGSSKLVDLLVKENEKETINSITLIGVCTDICVISNAMIIKAFLPETEILVDASCRAGVTVESHNNALEAMKCCQIIIINQ